MKKILVAVMAIAVACMCLVGCGTGDFEGKWECESMSLSGITINDDVIPLGAMMQLEVKSGGKATMYSNNNGKTNQATVKWEVSGDKLTLSPDNQPIDFKLKDGKLSVSLSQGGQTVGFTLKKVKKFSEYNEEDMKKALGALSGGK